MNQKTFAIGVSCVVGLVIVYGFFVVGTPAQERQRQFDDQRVNDLSMIQGQIFDYWMNKSSVPENLEALNDGLGYFTVPTDPETHSAYEYTVTDKASFTLCATFSLPSGAELNPKYSEPMVPGAGMSQTWMHEAGKTCFDRTIDPERYKPYDQPQKMMTPPVR